MAQATVPRMWRDSQQTAERSALRVRARAVAPAKRESEVNWKAMYGWLVIFTFVAAVYVALCGVVSELDAVKYRLTQEIALEQSHQARLVREINARASYGNLQSVIATRQLTSEPADVLPLLAPRALPAETPTVLLTPQPYRSYASTPPRAAPQQPTSAGLSDLP